MKIKAHTIAQAISIMWNSSKPVHGDIQAHKVPCVKQVTYDEFSQVVLKASSIGTGLFQQPVPNSHVIFAADLKGDCRFHHLVPLFGFSLAGCQKPGLALQPNLSKPTRLCGQAIDKDGGTGTVCTPLHVEVQKKTTSENITKFKERAFMNHQKSVLWNK